MTGGIQNRPGKKSLFFVFYAIVFGVSPGRGIFSPVLSVVAVLLEGFFLLIHFLGEEGRSYSSSERPRHMLRYYRGALAPCCLLRVVT